MSRRLIKFSVVAVTMLSLIAIAGCLSARFCRNQLGYVLPGVITTSIIQTADTADTADSSTETTDTSESTTPTSSTPAANAEAGTAAPQVHQDPVDNSGPPPPIVQLTASEMSVRQEAWFATALGRYMDPDGEYGTQCVDVADDYCIALWGDWTSTIGGVGYAYELFDVASSDYFRKIAYDASASVVPQRGDIIIWGSDKPDSHGAGHVAVVASVEATSMQVMEQDHDVNDVADLPCVLSKVGYEYVVGWLRPRWM